MTKYRWNTNKAARAFDAAAEYIHPHYLEIQDEILRLLGLRDPAATLVVDLGGGSGRLMQRVLELLPQATAVVIDQSESFLALAEERLSHLGNRAKFLQSRLQDDWGKELPQPADAIVSMSAIHHLMPDEKRSLYTRCHDYLAPKGVLYNGDEVRLTPDEVHLAALRQWADYKKANFKAGLIPEDFAEVMENWKRRNIDGFDEPKKSGDDCHETIETQIGYLRDAKFKRVSAKWRKELWAIFEAEC